MSLQEKESFVSYYKTASQQGKSELDCNVFAWSNLKKGPVQLKISKKKEIQKKVSDRLEHGNEDEGQFVEQVYEDLPHKDDPYYMPPEKQLAEAIEEAYEYGYEESFYAEPTMPPKDFFSSQEEYDAFLEGFRDGTAQDIESEDEDIDFNQYLYGKYGSGKTGEFDADFKPTKVLPPSPQNTCLVI